MKRNKKIEMFLGKSLMIFMSLLVIGFFAAVLLLSVEYCNNYTVTFRDIFFIVISPYVIWIGIEIIIEEIKGVKNK